MSHTISVTDESFDREILRAAKPVLVDFWAPWCGPCKAVAPLLEAMAEQYHGRVSVAKLNVDENTEAAQKWNVRAIPTLILFKDGEAVETRVGALDEAELKNLIEGAL